MTRCTSKRRVSGSVGSALPTRHKDGFIRSVYRSASYYLYLGLVRDVPRCGNRKLRKACYSAADRQPPLLSPLHIVRSRWRSLIASRLYMVRRHRVLPSDRYMQPNCYSNNNCPRRLIFYSAVQVPHPSSISKEAPVHCPLIGRTFFKHARLIASERPWT